MTNQPAQVNLHLQTAAGEVIRVMATLLFFGGIGALIWLVSQGAIAEQAGVVASAALMYFARRQWRRGVGADTAAPDTSGGATLAQSLTAALASQRGGTLALLGQSVVVGLAFLVAREVISIAMHPVIGGAAVYVSIATTAALAFLAQHLALRHYGSPPRDEGGVSSWVSLPGEDWQQHIWRIGRELTSGGDGYFRRCPPAVLVAASVGYGLVALGVRQCVSVGVHAASNVVVAIAISAVLGSFLLLPSLVPDWMSGLRRRTQAQSAAARQRRQQASAPAPMAPAARPIHQQPVAPAPTAPTTQPKRVVRRVKKEDNTDA